MDSCIIGRPGSLPIYHVALAEQLKRTFSSRTPIPSFLRPGPSRPCVTYHVRLRSGAIRAEYSVSAQFPCIGACDLTPLRLARVGTAQSRIV